MRPGVKSTFNEATNKSGARSSIAGRIRTDGVPRNTDLTTPLALKSLLF